MGKSQRVKGFGFEREVVNEAKAFGLEAKRSTCSFGVDVTIQGLSFECKRKKKFPEWLMGALKDRDGIIFRGDNGIAYVAISFKRFLEMLDN